MSAVSIETIIVTTIIPPLCVALWFSLSGRFVALQVFSDGIAYGPILRAYANARAMLFCSYVPTNISDNGPYAQTPTSSPPWFSALFGAVAGYSNFGSAKSNFEASLRPAEPSL